MKPFKVNEKSKANYMLMEGLADMNDFRANEFKKYQLATTYIADLQTYRDHRLQVMKAIDNNNISAIPLMMQRYEESLILTKNGNPKSYLFALICLRCDEHGAITENQKDIDEGFLTKKLEELTNEGLTVGQIDTEVLNFVMLS